MDGQENTCDPVWSRLRSEAAEMAGLEPMLAGFLNDTVLKHRVLERALSSFLAGKLASRYLTAVSLVEFLTRLWRPPRRIAWPCVAI